MFKAILKLAVGSARKIERIIAFSAALVIIVVSTFYLLAENQARKVIQEQLIQRQVALTRTGAHSLQISLSVLNSNLARLVEQDTVKNVEESQIQDHFLHFLQDTQEFYTIGVTRVDSDGIVVANSNPTTERGHDVSDRLYFIEAQNMEHRTMFVGEAITARFGIHTGKTIIPMSTPVFNDDGVFDGVVVTAVLFEDLTSGYLESLRFSPHVKVSLFTTSGRYIYTDYTSENNVTSEILHDTKTGVEGVFTTMISEEYQSMIVYENLATDTFAEDIILSMEVPQHEVLKYSDEIWGFQVNFMVITLTIIVSLSVFMITIIRILQRDAYMDGYMYGRDHMVKHLHQANNQR